MSENSTPFSKRTEDGFTVIEIVISLAVFSLLGTALLGVTVQAVKTFAETDTNLEYLSRTAMLEHHLRASLAEIRVPFWLPEFPPLEESDTLRLPYYRAEAGTRFTVRFEEGKVITDVTTEDDDDQNGGPAAETRIFRGYKGMSWEKLADADGNLIGIEFTFVPEDELQAPLTVAAAFGGTPFVDLYD
ncbi:MAG TPA: prepilin-type N-terminal cleavage/methylation domain-containing protein [Spirochaetia bacterium]|nr:prepilin-type N-terminal cleavage/methylation domain-containing protein [Spirochaetia bacterium]